MSLLRWVLFWSGGALQGETFPATSGRRAVLGTTPKRSIRFEG